MQKSCVKNKLHLRETKWHLELQCQLSPLFWKYARLFCSTINFDNGLKWLQYQILRNSLQTNYIVSHFKPQVGPLCSFCGTVPNFETISHLFWTCARIGDFLNEIIAFFTNIGLEFETSKLHFLFGNPNSPPFSIVNFASLVLKKYIWLTKFKSSNLTLVGFRPFFRSRIMDLIYYLKESKKPAEIIIKWDQIVCKL